MSAYLAGSLMWMASGLLALIAVSLYLASRIEDRRDRQSRRRLLAAKARQADRWPVPQEHRGRHATAEPDAPLSVGTWLR